jgi:hypothetical protein
MLATPKRGRYLWPASVSLFNLGRVVTKIGYNQTRVCRRVACPSGASDSVLSSPHASWPFSTYRLLPSTSLQPPPAV